MKNYETMLLLMIGLGLVVIIVNATKKLISLLCKVQNITSNKQEVKFEKLYENVKDPMYFGESSGFDLQAIKVLSKFNNYNNPVKNEEYSQIISLGPGERMLVSSGLKMELPKNLELQIRPRSGYSLKSGLNVIFGTVDSDYRGEIGIIISNISNTDVKFKIGERIAQGIIVPKKQVKFKEVSKIESNTERGKNGFGSTGKF